MRKSLQISLTAVFAALHTVLYFMSFGLWRNWGIYLESLEGIILGPKVGFLAAIIGSSIGRMIKPDDFWMFGIIAEPISVLTAGLLAKAKWKPVMAMYAVMLAAYFIHPYGTALPLWTILDILLALFIIYPVAKLSKNLFGNNVKHLPITLVLISFVCIATDSLVRVFLLIPAGLHTLFFPSFDILLGAFIEGASLSYTEDLIAVVVSLIIGVPLLISVSKLGLFKNEEKI